MKQRSGAAGARRRSLNKAAPPSSRGRQTLPAPGVSQLSCEARGRDDPACPLRAPPDELGTSPPDHFLLLLLPAGVSVVQYSVRDGPFSIWDVRWFENEPDALSRDDVVTPGNYFPKRSTGRRHRESTIGVELYFSIAFVVVAGYP